LGQVIKASDHPPEIAHQPFDLGGLLLDQREQRLLPASLEVPPAQLRGEPAGLGQHFACGLGVGLP